jgi:putative FmdB family regulatory protein
MPTYEYHCDACEHSFDELQAYSDPLLKKCPKCGKPKLRRVFGAGGGIIFKGSGFYQTDYRSESYKASAKAEQEKAKPAGEKDSANGKSDTSGGTSSPKTAKTAKNPSK